MSIETTVKFTCNHCNNTAVLVDDSSDAPDGWAQIIVDTNDVYLKGHFCGPCVQRVMPPKLRPSEDANEPQKKPNQS